MKKKYILPLVAMLSMIALTGCGGSESSTSSSSGDTTSSQTSSVQPSSEDDSSEIISSSDDSSEISSEDSSEPEPDSSSSEPEPDSSSSEPEPDSSSSEPEPDSSSSEPDPDTGSSSVEEIPGEGISLDHEYTYLEIDGEITLNASITPENANLYSITWSSDNEEVAVVDGGVVTGLRAGSATITASLGDGISASCTIYVKDAVTSIADINSASPASGDYYRIQGYVYSAGGTSAYVYDGTAGILVYNWNNSSAVNDSGLTDGNFVQGSYVDIYGKISLYSSYNNLIELIDDDSATSYVHSYTPASEISVSSAGTILEGSQLAEMVYNNVYTVRAKLVSGSGRYWVFNVDDTQIEYVLNSYDPNYSTVNAAFAALTVGEIYDITATSYGYSSSYGYCFQAFGDYYNIEEVAASTPTSFTLAIGSDTITVGSTTSVSIESYAPWYADASSVSWSSSNTEVATVAEDGTVTGVAAGDAIITGTIGDVSATIAIIISAEPVYPESIEVTIDNPSIALNGTATATAAISPAAADQSVTWSSSDTSIATIDENGNIAAVSAGTATITATSTANEVTGSATITVNNYYSEALVFNADFNSGYTSISTEGWEKTVGDITITHEKAGSSTNVALNTDGTGLNYLDSNSHVRLYQSSVTTFTLAEGYIFDSITTVSASTSNQFTAANATTETAGATIGDDSVAFESAVNVFSFTAAKQLRLTSITINYVVGEVSEGETGGEEGGTTEGGTTEGGEEGGTTEGGTTEGGEEGGTTEGEGGDTGTGGETGGEQATETLIGTYGFNIETTSTTAYSDGADILSVMTTTEGTEASTVISSISDLSRVYPGYSGYPNALKFGGSSAAGSITFNLAEGYTFTKVVLNMSHWNSSDVFSVNDVAESGDVTVPTYQNGSVDVTWEFAEAQSTLKIDTANRGFIYSISLYGTASESGSTEGEDTGTTEETTYDIPEGATEISTVDEFNAFFDGNATNYQNSAYLTADIDLSSSDVSGLRMAGDYSGIFEGCGHTITTNSSMTAIFNLVSGTVRNVNVVSNSWSTSGFGVVAYANNGGTFDNVDVEVTISSSINSWGPVAFWSTGTISNCDATIHIAADANQTNTVYGAARADDGSSFSNNTYYVDGDGSASISFTAVEGVTLRDAA